MKIPELIEARLKQIRTLSRKEALPIILGDKKNYCVAGAHGNLQQQQYWLLFYKVLH